jgi:drug/metabolite transporter (DMT)-like permease
MFLVIAANALFASTYSIGKFLLVFMSPMYLNALRMTIAGILLLGYQYCFQRHQFYIKSMRAFFYILIIAFFNSFLSYVLEFWALQYIPSIKVTFLYNTAPLITPLFSYFFFSEHMTLKKWLGLIIGLVGVILSLVYSDSGNITFNMMHTISLPELAVILGVVVYCYGWVFVRKLIRTYHYEPITINGWTMFIGGIFSWMAALALEQWRTIENPASFLIGLLALIILGNLLANTMYTTLFKYYTVTFISLSSLTIPLFASVYGYFFLGEKLTLPLVISMIIVLVGVYIFYQEELRQGYVIRKH